MKIKSYGFSTNKRQKLIAYLLGHPKDLLVTVFMLNTLVNILLQNVASSHFGQSAGWGLKIGVPFIITLIFGEIIPKNIGMRHNETIAYRSAPLIHFFYRSLSLLRKWTVDITHPISKALFFFLKKEPDISKEELTHVLKSSHEKGVLTTHEAFLASGYLNFQYATVKELMRPRDEVIFYNIQDPITKLSTLFIDKQISRLPIIDGSIDQMIGTLSAKEFFINQHKIKDQEQLINYLFKPIFTPESTTARALLQRLNKNNQQMAIVVDEYGAITGLITREDLIEEVIGEIKDPKDLKKLYTLSGKNEIIASGKLELSDLNSIFGSSIKSSSHMVSLGGWLTEAMGKIPQSGDQFEQDELIFHVLSAKPNYVRRIFIRKRRLK